MSNMAEEDAINKIQSELHKGMGLPKCRRCGCMKEALEELRYSLSSPKTRFLQIWLNISNIG
ncbi:MAG: hypothetical protein QXR26_01495 [Candidatus Caldarchaeum sp.]